jgi:gliding motility-associated-like protein
VLNESFVSPRNTNEYTFKPIKHREYFWKNIPTVFNVKLDLYDTVHPLKCKHGTSTIITLLGASAKNVRFSGVYCLGGASPQYGVNLHLDDTKPGATSNWAWVNWDVNLDPTAWLKMHDTTNGAVQQGVRPGGLPVMMPYGLNGMYGTTYSTAYTAAMIKNRKSGCVKIGVVVGTGVTYNPGKYPECVDTQYYEDAVCFPVMDPAFEVLEPAFRSAIDPATLKMCKNTEIVMKLTDDNLTNTDVVNFLQWRLTTNVAGPDTSLRYGLSIFETYLRNQTDPNDPNKLLDILISTRLTSPLQTQTQNIPAVTTSADTFVIAHILEWDTAVNFDPIWDAVDERLKDAGFDIFELTSSQIRNMFGVASCGLDTSGLGPILKSLEYIKPTKRVTKHFRDTTISPFEQRTIGGKLENVVVFTPEHNGLYNLSLTMDGGKDHCVIGSSRLIAVGFYSNVWYNDSIVCHQDLAGLKSKANFYYYNTNPLIPAILDYNPYWDPRKNPGRKYGGDKVPGTKEDFVRWDWSIDDDDLGNPVTIFGGSPYSNTGYDTLTLGGGLPSSIYYKDWGIYQMRITTGDSSRSPNQCRDTLVKNLYVTDVQAGFALSANRPQCTNIVQVFDTSKMFDPCVDTFWVDYKGDTIRHGCDNIINYYINFGDGKGYTQWPADVWRNTKIGWNYTSNGDYTITLIVETARGCRDTVTQDLYIPGPQPNFETISSREICVNEFVSFANKSNNPSSSAKWTWDFGDGEVSSTNFGNSNGGRDTLYHTYSKAGVYQVFLTQFDSIPNTNKYCPGTYPDTINGKQIPITILVNAIDSVTLFADGERDTLRVCPNQDVNFNVTADKSIYSSFVFGYGDGDTFTTSDTVATHAYKKAGVYIGTINPRKDPLVTKKVCPMTDTVIIIVEDVVADFDIDTTDKPIFCFKNTSTGGTSYRWGYYHKEKIDSTGGMLLEDYSANDKKENCNSYRDSLGSWYVCLEATNSIGCTDTICKKVEYTYLFEIIPYNVFTPNKNSTVGDDKNDQFVIDIAGHTKFKITIVNRWGQKVFTSEDNNKSWNGKVNNSGALSPDGTYYYVITYEHELDDEEHCQRRRRCKPLGKEHQ